MLPTRENRFFLVFFWHEKNTKYLGAKFFYWVTDNCSKYIIQAMF